MQQDTHSSIEHFTTRRNTENNRRQSNLKFSQTSNIMKIQQTYTRTIKSLLTLEFNKTEN